MTEVNANLVLLDKRGDCHHEELNSIKRKQKRQEAFNRQMEEKMQVLEGTIEDQAERIVALEEEVAVLRAKKACKCGEVEASSAGTGTQEDPLGVDLEYARTATCVVLHGTLMQELFICRNLIMQVTSQKYP